MEEKKKCSESAKRAFIKYYNKMKNQRKQLREQGIIIKCVRKQSLTNAQQRYYQNNKKAHNTKRTQRYRFKKVLKQILESVLLIS